MAKSIKRKRWLEIFSASTKLGFTSFGGPVAHLGYFKNEYIDKRKWLDDKTYADIIALCQFLPGPASSQVGIAIGMLRGGLLGGLISWIGFTLPSILALVLFAFFYQSTALGEAGWIHGLKIVAVAVVAQAVIGMGQKLTPDKPRITIAIVAAVMTLAWPSALGQILIILAASMAGLALYRKQDVPEIQEMDVSISKRTGIIAWGLFFTLLIGLPLLRPIIQNGAFDVFDTFFRVGSLVFGGGHVVLPLLEREVVPIGWVNTDEFLAGYGMAQAVPGPLFTFASYLGAMINGIGGAVIATIGIFLPSFLLIIGSLPFFNEVRKRPRFQAALTGINAAVVGLLLAALYDPVWTSSIKTTQDFILALVLFGLLFFWKYAPWLVVLIGALGGYVLTLIN
ncbi:chromate transporter [Pseudalkalibacillus sp. SCS-8]|uniref:chromate transporter n=1 Tax=Pseudalkalibacillus nanhaiensis TaxID=3115291 RepID=UPI0032DAE12C